MKQGVLTLGLALVASGFVFAQTRTAPGTTSVRQGTTAGASLIDAEGRTVGEATLQQASNGILLKLTLKNATPGIHGLHFHDVGRCDRPTFESAGGHFNPSARQHGFLNTRGPHTGDLPNLDVPTTTQLAVEYFIRDVTLEGGPASLHDANGTAIVIHAGKDDYATDPAGDSGERLACGAIQFERVK
jgi:superoxide dismutase, Cu-Zn family